MGEDGRGRGMRILALDLSLTSTGWCRDGVTGVYRPKSKGVERLIAIREQIWLLTHEPISLVVLEGYAFGRPNAAHYIGELGGVVKVALAEWKIPVAIVPPAVLKKYATGKGNGTKDAVLSEAIRRLNYTGSSHDEADALWLWAMARDAYEEPVAEVPKPNREALGRVEWWPA